jgi:predicted component of viral defense system (DUF524 family)
MWQKCEDNNKSACWKKDGFKLRLEEIHGKSPVLTEENPRRDLKIPFKISQVVVEEWKELKVEVEGSSGKKVEKIYFGGQEAERIYFREQESGEYIGLWIFAFRNYLGKSYIRVKFKNGEEIITDPIEVISSKTTLKETDEGGKLSYCQFLKALIDDLIYYLATCPFEISSPTEFYTEEYPHPSSPVFILHTLAHNAEAIIQALQTIWHNPYRKLATEERWLFLNEAKHVDEDTIVMMLKHPEYLHEYEGEELGHLAGLLKNNATDKKYVPLKVYQREFIESLDNPENRFIKKFMDIILYWYDELERLNILEENSSHKEQIERLRNYVRYLRADPLFSDVGEMSIFPASSQVLLKRDGYRECLNIYRLLHLARIPIFNSIQEAIDNRRIDQLYEYWCFFKLSELLAKVISGEGAKPKFRLIQTTKGGLGDETIAELGNGYTLVYNKTWKKGEESYSVSLRPDFSLIKDGKLEVVFDAKFRFDLKIKEDSEREVLEIEDLEEAEEEAISGGNFERIAKFEDIYKMHTYRDALQCRAAFVVYPGDKCMSYNRREICNNGQERKGKEENLREMLFKIISKGNEKWEGVGFIALVPGEDNEEKDIKK